MNRAGFNFAMLMLGLIGLMAIGCSGRGDAQAEPSSVSSGRAAVAVEVAPAVLGETTETLELTGSLTSKDEAAVRSEYPGTIVEVAIREWVQVKKGDPLARLDTREVESKLRQTEAEIASARADVLKAEASADRAVRDFDRIAKLRKDEIVSEQDLDNVRKEKAATAADVAAAKARLTATEAGLHEIKLRRDKSVLRAPMAGIVATRRANVGDMVDASSVKEPLFRIVDNRLLELTLTVPSTSVGQVRVGQPIVFSTDALPGKTFKAQVKHINPAADAATRAVGAVAEISNENQELRDGLFVKGRIIIGRRSGILLIPRAALLPLDEVTRGADLFVVEGEKARRRTIQPGREIGDLVEVTSGLKAGEKVVTRGGFLLRDGDPVKIAATTK